MVDGEPLEQWGLEKKPANKRKQTDRKQAKQTDRKREPSKAKRSKRVQIGEETKPAATEPAINSASSSSSDSEATATSSSDSSESIAPKLEDQVDNEVDKNIDTAPDAASQISDHISTYVSGLKWKGFPFYPIRANGSIGPLIAWEARCHKHSVGSSRCTRSLRFAAHGGRELT